MVKIQVYASFLVLTLATSSALALPLRDREFGIRQRDLDSDQEFSQRELEYLDALNANDDFEARGPPGTLDKVKKMFKPKKSNPKPVYESLPDRPQRMDSDPSHGLDLAKVESHLIKTAGILWGIRRRDFDEGNMDFLVERAMTDAVDDLD